MYRGVLKVAGIALVAVLLLGLLLGGVVRWRESASRLRCADNLRRTGWFALWTYTDPATAFPKGPGDAHRPLQLDLNAPVDANKLFPPGTLPNAGLAPDRRLSWQVILLPYVGREELNAKIDRTRAWDDPLNHDAVCTLVPVYVCPTQYRPGPADTPQITHYIGLAGLGPDSPMLPQTDPRAGFFRYDDPTKTGSVVRGFSRTITILETATNLGPWAAVGPSTVRGLDPANQPYIGGQFGGHPQGANAAFADGSVRFQTSDISPRVLEMLSTLAPGLE